MKQKEYQTGLFSDLGLEQSLLNSLSKKGFEKPTPIQHQVIIPALEGNDIVGIAQTGTGKTFAFGLPMIQHLLKGNGQGLILVPTRELALQVEEAFLQIGRSLGLKTVVVMGGVPQYQQVRGLQKNPHLIIATPGRLVDLVEQGVCPLGDINIVTLDEADRMLDMGFLSDIRDVLKKTRKDRQTLLFSATMPNAIAKLASEFMKTPLRIEIAPEGTSSENIEQEVYIIRSNQKMRLLDTLLEKYADEKVLIFSRTKHGAKRMKRDIENVGHYVTEIHGNRSQHQRKKALEGFTRGQFRIMVATDIAARGIDVKDIGIVINYDLPDSLEDYVHRIGRTGRAGRSGKAISFVAPSKKYTIRKIEQIIRKTLEVVSLPELLPERQLVKRDDYPSNGRGRGRSSDRGGRSFGRKRFSDSDERGSRGRSSNSRRGERGDRNERGSSRGSWSRSSDSRGASGRGRSSSSSDSRRGERGDRNERGSSRGSWSRSSDSRGGSGRGRSSRSSDSQRSNGGYKGNCSFGERGRRRDDDSSNDGRRTRATYAKKYFGNSDERGSRGGSSDSRRGERGDRNERGNDRGRWSRSSDSRGGSGRGRSSYSSDSRRSDGEGYKKKRSFGGGSTRNSGSSSYGRKRSSSTGRRSNSSSGRWKRSS